MKKFIILYLISISILLGQFVPEEELQSYQYDIIKLAIEQVNREVSYLALLKKYNLTPPILPPRLDAPQVAALIRREVEERVAEKFPLSRLKEIQEEAKEKYRLYKVGDFVTVEITDVRRGVKVQIQRHIREITARGIRLGDDFYSFNDISESEYPHFFKEKHQEAVEREIRIKTNEFNEARKAYEKEIYDSLAEKIWQGEGYIFNRAKNQWVAKIEALQEVYQREWLKKFNEIKNDVEVLVLEKNGFVWDEKAGQWRYKGEQVVQEKTPDTQESGTILSKKKVGSLIEAWGSELQKIFSSGSKEEKIWEEEEKNPTSPSNEPKK